MSLDAPQEVISGEEVDAKEYFYLVIRIAYKLVQRLPYGSAVDVQDLIQEGYIALLDVAKRYDKTKGPFENFATPRIRGAMLDYLRTLAMDSRGQRKLRREAEKAALASGKPLDSTSYFHQGPMVIALDELYNLPDSKPSAEEKYGDKELIELFFRSLAPGTLNIREIFVLYHHFITGEMVKEIAKIMQTCASRVSQILNRALEKLREAATDLGFEPPSDGVIFIGPLFSAWAKKNEIDDTIPSPIQGVNETHTKIAEEVSRQL